MKIVSLICLLIATFWAKEAVITSDDGFQLYGWLETPKQTSEGYPVALFAHQFAADHTIWNDLAKEMRALGYATLLVDLRGHGRSILQKGKENRVVDDVQLDHIEEAFKQSNQRVGFDKIPDDLALWIDYLGKQKQIDMGQLVLFGSSLGGGAIIPLMVEYEPIALISISPGGGDEEAINTSLSYAETQTLFIAGKNDPLGAQNRALEYATKALRGTYLMISSDGHGTVLLPRVQSYIFQFLQEL